MIRALSILAAVAALAVSAAPVASADTSKKAPPRVTTAHEYGHLTNYLTNAWDPNWRYRSASLRALATEESA